MTKGRITIEAVAENTNTMKELVSTMQRMEETENMKIDLLKRHYEIEENYRQEKLKILKTKHLRI